MPTTFTPGAVAHQIANGTFRTRHTPGPWAVVNCCNCISIGLEADAGAGGGLSIAFTERTDEQVRPDMTLVAAAPELLAALIEIASQLTSHPDFERGNSKVHFAAYQALNAIGKVVG